MIAWQWRLRQFRPLWIRPKVAAARVPARPHRRGGCILSRNSEAHSVGKSNSSIPNRGGADRYAFNYCPRWPFRLSDRWGNMEHFELEGHSPLHMFIYRSEKFVPTVAWLFCLALLICIPFPGSHYTRKRTILFVCYLLPDLGRYRPAICAMLPALRTFGSLGVWWYLIKRSFRVSKLEQDYSHIIEVFSWNNFFPRAIDVVFGDEAHESWIDKLRGSPPPR